MSKEIRIGILAVVTIAVAIWGYKFLLGQNILTSQQIFEANFDNVDMLRSSNAVIIKGFQVGTVIDIIPDPDDLSMILVTFEVDSDWKIPKDTEVSLVNDGIMGTKMLRLDINRTCQGDDCAQSGDRLEGKTLSLLESVVSQGELRQYAEEISAGLNVILDTLEGKISDPDSRDAVSESVRSLRNTLTNLASSTERLDLMLSNSSSQFENVMTNLEKITGTIASNSAKIDRILSNTADFTEELKESKLTENVSGFVDKSSETLTKLDETLASANQSFDQLARLLQKIESEEGTMGKLVNSEELYQNLERTTKNLELLLQDFRLNPKRYLDIRVFGGKKQREYILPEEDPAFLSDTLH